MKEIDHEYTDNLICPYCGYEDQDSWELSESSDNYTCGDCSKNFTYNSSVSRTFTSQKADCLNGAEHNWRDWHNVLPELKQRSCRTCNKREILKVEV